MTTKETTPYIKRRIGMEQKIVVSGVLVHNGKALLVRRSASETFLAGYYEFPGGKVDFGESVQEALVREFSEEVGLTIEVGEFLRSFSYVTGTRHTVELVFFVHGSGEVKLSDAHDDYKWVSGADVKCSDEIRKSLEMVF